MMSKIRILALYIAGGVFLIIGCCLALWGGWKDRGRPGCVCCGDSMGLEP